MSWTAVLLAVAIAGAGTVETETERPYSDDDLFYMSHIVQAEAGYCSREMMEGVASVVINRVNDDRFPDTVKEVVEQPGQYSPMTNGTFWNEPTEEAIEVSEDILTNGSVFPENVVWQANFSQGQGTYKTISTTYSTMYFCY
jgi:hypothetical protein